MQQINKYRLIFFLRYLGDSFFLSFFSLYLLSLNITGSRLGFILAILQATSIVFNPLWGLVTKNPRVNLTIVSWMVFFEAIAVIVFWQFVSFEIIAIIIFCIGIVNSPYHSIQDGLIGSYCEEHSYDFATVRIFGSISYVLATALGGFIITYLGFKVSFIIASCLYLIVFALWKTIKPPKLVDEEVLEKGSFKSVLKNKDFLIYVIVFIFGIGSLAVGDSYFGVYLDSRNINMVTIGLLTSGIIFVEVLMVHLMIRRKFNQNYRILIILSLTFILLRNIAFSFDPPFKYILIFSILKGLGWGGIVSVHLNYLVSIVKKKDITYAIMFLTSIYSLFVALMNYLTGMFYQVYGFSKVYLMLSFLTVIGIIVSVFIKDTKKTRI